jgi:hypothetical protein
MNDPKILEITNTYYKLKQRYEEALQTRKKKISTNSSLSLTEKRERVRQMRLPCVHCKNPVGTIFIEKKRKLQAKCGATSRDKFQPCELNILIQKGDYGTISWAIDMFDNSKEHDKDEIIKTKLNLFFQFSDESNTLAAFDKIKTEFIENNKEYELYLNELIEATPYLKNKKLIAEHNDVITKKKYEIIELIQKGKNNSDKQFTKDAVELYINDLMPMIEKDRALKYSYYNLEQDFYIAKQNNLVQSEIAVKDTEFIIENDPEVIQYTK